MKTSLSTPKLLALGFCVGIHVPPLPPADEPRIYPCIKCGKMRTKSEGGTVFSVCDECWDSIPVVKPEEPK